jgi:hypothetical protein
MMGGSSAVAPAGASGAPEAGEGKEGQVYDFKQFEEVVDRERLLNDLTNTGVIAALLGGFALSCLSIDLEPYGAHTKSSDTTLAVIGTIYWMVAFLAAHVCTLSAASSALLYRKINLLSDETALPWLQQNKRLKKMPLVCFMIGIKLYEVSIVLFGLLYFHGSTALQTVSTVLGLICCMGILAVAWMTR